MATPPLTITFSLAGPQKALARISASVGPEGRHVLHAIAGNRMANTEAPTRFRESGPGWAPLKWRQGRPLLNTGVLVKSVTYRASADEVVVGSSLVHSRLHNLGGVVRPVRAKWLAIPLVPPLSATEARVRRPRDFNGAFVLMKGPEGPGLYRKAGGGARSSLRTRRTSYASGSRGIERIFAFVKSVKIPARPYLEWTNRAMTNISRLWVDEIRRRAEA